MSNTNITVSIATDSDHNLIIKGEDNSTIQLPRNQFDEFLLELLSKKISADQNEQEKMDADERTAENMDPH